MKSVLMTSALIGSLISCAYADSPPNPYLELKSKFEGANVALSAEDLLGNYLGRCYNSADPDQPQGMVLTTVSHIETPTSPVQYPDQGPLFPDQPGQKTPPPQGQIKYQMAQLEATRLNSDGWSQTPAPYSDNDSLTSSDIKKFWKNPKALITSGADSFSVPLVINDLQISNNTAAEVTFTDLGNGDGENQKTVVKKGTDGYFYSKFGDFYGTPFDNLFDSSEDALNPTYCYYWKKLSK